MKHALIASLLAGGALLAGGMLLTSYRFPVDTPDGGSLEAVSLSEAPRSEKPDVFSEPEDSGQEEVVDALASCGNYLSGRRAEYDAYQRQFPQFTPQEVVTYVNIGLNRPYYTQIEEIAEPDSLLVLCNKYRALPKDYQPEDLTALPAQNAISGRTVYLRREAAEAFTALCSAAKAEGYIILGQSGFRSYSYQQQLYTNYVAADGQKAADTYSARPGHSEHQTGLAIDVRNASKPYTSFGQTAEYQWMKDNGHLYGFVLHYLPEKEWITGYKTEEWHFRYVGKEAAAQIHETGLTFDEYCATYLEAQPGQAVDGEAS